MSSQSGSGSGLGQPMLWSERQRRGWVPFLFLGSVLLYAARNSMSVSIVEMAFEMDWNKKVCGTILSSFFWGYTASQMIGGQLADKYGGEVVLWIASLVWSLALLFIGACAQYSTFLVMLGHLLNGLSQGFYFPAISSLLTARVSDDSRSFIYSIIHSGPQVGSIITGLLGYKLLFKKGWEYLFFSVGIASLFWCFLLRWLSRQLQRKMHYQLLDTSSKSDAKEKAISVNLQKKDITCIEVPWRDMVRQGPVLAMFYASFCEGFFFNTLMAWLPTFFHDTFRNEASNTWKYNIAPWIAGALATALAGWIANTLIKRGTSITATRKTMEGISLLGAGSCILVLGLVCVGSSPNFSISLGVVITAFLFQGFQVAGVGINPIDLAPSYSGLLFGAMNSFSALPGIFGVPLVGHILHSSGSWSYVFFLISFVNISGFVIYTVFGSAKRLTHIDS